MSGGSGALGLLDWRRRVHALYAEVRAVDPLRGTRDVAARPGRTVRRPRAVPIDRAAARASFIGLPVAPYDPPLRFVCALEPAAAERRDVVTGSDGVVPLERIGLVRPGELGTLDVWWLAAYGGGVFLPLRDASAGHSTLRRWPLRARHHQGRRPRRHGHHDRPGHRHRRRPQLRLPPVVHVRPGVGVPAGARRQHCSTRRSTPASNCRPGAGTRASPSTSGTCARRRPAADGRCRPSCPSAPGHRS